MHLCKSIAQKIFEHLTGDFFFFFLVGCAAWAFFSSFQRAEASL